MRALALVALLAGCAAPPRPCPVPRLGDSHLFTRCRIHCAELGRVADRVVETADTPPECLCAPLATAVQP